MRGGLFLGGEEAGAFQRDVDVAPGQFLRVADGGDADRAAADVDGVAGNGDGARELAVDGVIANEMRIGLDRAEVVDGNDFDVGAAGLDDGAQHVAADAAKTVDGNFHSHFGSLPMDELCEVRRGRGAAPWGNQASLASAAATTASGVMPKCL